MKTVTAAMATYLAGDFIELATCLQVYLKNGDTLSVTDWQTPVTYAGITYSSLFETYARGNVRTSSDLSTPSVEATGLTGQTTLGGNGVDEADIQAGFFDGATFILFQMVPTDTNAATYGIIRIRAGRLGVITNAEGQYTFSLDGWATILQQNFTDTYNLACNADLFDSRCGLSPTAFTDSGTVTSLGGPANQNFSVTNSTARATGFYNFGVFTWVTGANADLSMEVKSWNAQNLLSNLGAIYLYLPMAYDVQVGDTFTVQSGCDKSLSTCVNTYSNAINHRGFPYIPGLDTYFYANASLQYPNSAS